MSMGADDTYEVIFAVDDSEAAKAIDRTVAAARRMDQQFQQSVTRMNQYTARMADQAGDAMKRPSQEMPQITNHFAKIGEFAKSATSEIGRMAASFVLFTAAREIISSMKDGLSDLRSYTEKMNNDLISMQTRLAEVQSITSRAGGSQAEVIAEHLDLMKYTGMSSEQAKTFAEEFTGSAEVARGKFDPGEFAQIQRNTARFAMIHGGDIGSHAILAGRLAGMAAPGTTAEQLTTRQANIYGLLNLAEGRTQAVSGSYAEALSKLVSPTGAGGMVSSPEALAQLAVGASKVAGAGAIDTRLEQFSRAATGMSRSKDWTKFLREELKINPEASADEAMKPIFDAMERAGAQGMGPARFLRSKGMTNSAEVLAVAGMYGQRQFIYDAQARAPMTTAESNQTLTDPYTPGTVGFRGNLAQQRERASLQAVEIENAQREQIGMLFRDRAKRQLTQEGQIGERWRAGLGIVESAQIKSTDFTFGKGTYEQQKIDERALQLAERAYGKRVRGHDEYMRSFGSLNMATGKHEDNYAGYGYAASNQVLSDIADLDDAKKVGDRSGPSAWDDPGKPKKVEIVTDHSRKERPMTVPKPAPRPRT